MMGVELAGKRVYISGPMSGLRDFNREQFAEAARYLRNQGARAFNPAFTADVDNTRPYSAYMLRDLNELTSHMDGVAFYDMMALLPGWKHSRGANVEMIVAKACGIETFEI